MYIDALGILGKYYDLVLENGAEDEISQMGAAIL
jgi:hypothetical protein